MGLKPPTLPEDNASNPLGIHWRHELLPLTLAVTACYLLAAMLSFQPTDPAWSTSGESGSATYNWGGPVGAWIVDVLFNFFGQVALLLPLVLLAHAYRLLRGRRTTWQWRATTGRGFSFLLFLCSVCAIATLLGGAAGMVYSNTPILSSPIACSAIEGRLPCGTGGVIGMELAHRMTALFGNFGTRLLLFAVALLSLSHIAQFSWLSTATRFGHWLRYALHTAVAISIRAASALATTGRYLSGALTAVIARRRPAATALSEAESVAALDSVPKVTPSTVELSSATESDSESSATIGKPIPQVSALPAPEIAPPVKHRSQSKPQSPIDKGNGMPALGLLDQKKVKEDLNIRREELEALGQRLESRLKDFGISAEVVSIYPGPVITRFEIRPAAGIKVSRISSLAKDLARSLAVISVRVVEVIPGKSVVGIEVPNEHRTLVSLHDVLASPIWSESTAPLSLALGHDISGHPVVVDLAKMPHLLVAGTTGAGKSVGVNAMLLSLLLKSPPEQVRLILVDPKMLELSVYDGIPHLLTPVITDMKDAARGLRWCVAEMERRYKLMATLGVRNIAGYNRRIHEALETGKPLQPRSADDNIEGGGQSAELALEPLPLIVVVIDEFADMMMIVGKKVEQLIARIAQKARAAGIHLVLATQRPSVDVITGLIKANIPSRIAYQVSSRIDARTIMDQSGAEQLLGHGDMLYLPAGGIVPTRVHGAFVSDEEVHRVVAEWKKQSEPNYLSLVLDVSGEESTGDYPLPSLDDGEEQDGEKDPLYDQALSFVIESRRSSISAVQRKLRIGYNRAARLIEIMEQSGVVSPMESNGSREVLVPARDCE